MNRNEWKFTYGADELLKQAALKMKHHEKRHDWWTKKRVEVVDQIKKSGIDVDQSLSDMSMSNSYHRGGNITIDEKLARDLQEAFGKQKEHERKITDYAGWVQVLSSQGKNIMQLDQEDWMFFFSSNDPTIEVAQAIAAKLAA